MTVRLVAENRGHRSVTANGCRYMSIYGHVRSGGKTLCVLFPHSPPVLFSSILQIKGRETLYTTEFCKHSFCVEVLPINHYNLD